MTVLFSVLSGILLYKGNASVWHGGGKLIP